MWTNERMYECVSPQQFSHSVWQISIRNHIESKQMIQSLQFHLGRAKED